MVTWSGWARARSGSAGTVRPDEDRLHQDRLRRVYDPANGVDGEVRDIWIADGKIVEPPDRSRSPAGRAIDAARPGRHARRRGHALPHRRPEGQPARKMRPEDSRDGAAGVRART